MGGTLDAVSARNLLSWTILNVGSELNAHRELLHELGLRTSTTIVSTSGEAMARECPKKGGAALFNAP